MLIHRLRGRPAGARLVSTLGLLAASALASVAAGQEPPTLDEVSQQAAKLEGELGQVLDGTPEAAERMLRLLDLYHQHGRAFGLVNIGQRFLAAHPQAPQVRDVALKTLDGLRLTGREAQVVPLCRQFLSRFPQDGAAPAVEELLARALRRVGQPRETAEAHEALWRRGGERAREAAAIALRKYNEMNNVEGWVEAARFGEQLLDQLPNSPFVREAAWQAFHAPRRHSDWAKASRIGGKILARGLFTEKNDLLELRYYLTESHWNQGQHQTAIDHAREAARLEPTPERYRRWLYFMYHAGFKADQLEPAYNEAIGKFPEHPDRWQLLSYVAHGHHRAGQHPQAAAFALEVLRRQPRLDSAAHYYVEWAGADKAQHPQIEQNLTQAIAAAKSPADASYLRYVLAIRLYRDRAQDAAKARPLALQVALAPSGGEGWECLHWLLASAPDEAAFQDVLTKALAANPRFLGEVNYGANLVHWLPQLAAGNKEFAARCAWGQAEAEKFLQTPFARHWKNAFVADAAAARAARAELLKPETLATLGDGMAWNLLWHQAESYRNDGDAAQRPLAIPLFQRLCQRFPQNQQASDYWLYATDYGTPDDRKVAAEHRLKIEPEGNHSEMWHRMLRGPIETKDAALGQRVVAYIEKSQQKHGLSPYHAHQVAQFLELVDQKPAALDYLRKRHLALLDDWQGRECVARLLERAPEPAEKIKLLEGVLAANPTAYRGAYASWLAEQYFAAGDLAKFEAVLRQNLAARAERPYAWWGMEEYPAMYWIDRARSDAKLSPEQKKQILAVTRDAAHGRVAASATLALYELEPPRALHATQRLLAYQDVIYHVGQAPHEWDSLFPYAQAAMGRKDYAVSATLLASMLNGMGQIGPERQKAGRDMLGLAYSRLGGVGLVVDEASPLAPLLSATLYLRLGDERLALDTFQAHRELFRERRLEAPFDLILFVCDNLSAAGGEENAEFVEDTLRSWLIRFSEVAEVEEANKAAAQLLLAKNYFRAQRFDVARGEFATVINRYGKTPQAIEAEFGIGESYLAQKVYDQAEQAFEKLAASQDRDIAIRAEFLRGVLAHRRGDRDDAREIFRNVLERVPNIELANQTLFNLAEVYGAEERYVEQLELLRTVGRLGRVSKRFHTPGSPLSIVVQDSDLGISRGHARIPVKLVTEPGGDEEIVYLTSGGAGKGLFRTDVETRLGQAAKGNKVLELTGRDVIRCDYPAEFKAEFRSTPLSDAEIRVAASAKLQVSGAKIIDETEETFTERLTREARERELADQRRSQQRPANQIKPGNPIYLRVTDADRDLTDAPDTILVKLGATSGDQVQLNLVETGPHTGVFEGVAPTGGLPAGALASDASIDHGPLMAIDPAENTAWESAPDGATPKWLTIDLKDLKPVARVAFRAPHADKQTPLRMRLQGSHDGRFYYTLHRHPQAAPPPDVAGEFGPMTMRVYPYHLPYLASWEQVAALTRAAAPTAAEPAAERLEFKLAPDAPNAASMHAVVWQGKLVQPRRGALRLRVEANFAAVMVDGALEQAVGPGHRDVDVWLERGVHDLTIYAGVNDPRQGARVLRAWENTSAAQVALAPFSAADFDLARAPAAALPKPLLLGAADAKVAKKTPEFGPHTQSGPTPRVGHWRDLEDVAEWNVDVAAPGVYEVWAAIAHAGEVGSRFALEFAGQKFEQAVPDTKDWNAYHLARVGAVEIDKPGPQKLVVRPLEIKGGGLMDLFHLALKPATGVTTARAANDVEFRLPPRELRHVRLMIDEYQGESVALGMVEVGGPDGAKYIPTEADVLALAKNNTLEVAPGDTLTASYTDEFTPTASGAARVLSGSLSATYFNASVGAIGYDFERLPGGQVVTLRKLLMRVDPGERFVFEIVDYDRDQTGTPDQVEFTVSVNEGPPVKMIATETEPYSGVFTKEIDTAAAGDKPTGAGGERLALRPGDRVVCRYVDEDNTYPGHAAPREAVVYARQPTPAKIRVIETRVAPPPSGVVAPPTIIYSSAAQPTGAVSRVDFSAPLTIEVLDPDAAKTSRSQVLVQLAATGGAKIEARCVVAPAPGDGALAEDALRQALEDGRFIGQVVLRLGGKDSPDVVPITADTPRDLVGGGVLPKSVTGASAGSETLVTRVLNVTGQDVITAVYNDQFRPDGKPAPASAQARLISNGVLSCLDREYDKPVKQLHVGEKLYLMVVDPDLDTSDQRDVAEVVVTTRRGEKETVRLFETLAHGGVFTGSVRLQPAEKPLAGNLDPANPVIETFFGDALELAYVDQTASTETGSAEHRLAIPVAVGDDGLVTAFSKVFNDETLAVETQFRVAECHFELFKSHKALGRVDEQRVDLENGRRVLRELREDYPHPKYAPRVAYLLGQFSQELGEWDEAIAAYQTILRQHADSSLAADAQYKLAQCHEEAGDFDNALEAYVTLAATYPKSPLIANVMVRITDHYYKKEDYVVSAQVAEKFLERFEGHEWAPRLAFRVGQCYYKSKQFAKAGDAFDKFSKRFPDDKLCSDAMFWSGESYRMGGNTRDAFRRYNRCRWDFPSSEAAKYARGRLALPEMLAQFEAEANVDDNP